MDFTKEWEDKYRRLEQRLESTRRYSDSQFLVDYEQKNFDAFKALCEHMAEVGAVFGVSSEEMKKIIPPRSYIAHCDLEELKEKYSYFKGLFGDKLTELVNIDHISMATHYEGFFSYKNYRIVEEKINKAMSLFNISFEQFIKLLYSTSHFLYLSPERVEQYILETKEFLGLTQNQAIEMYLTYPRLIEISSGLRDSRVERLCAFFSCGVDEIKRMYRNYPPTMFYAPSDINNCLRFNENRTPEIKAQIRSYPWVLQCISREVDREYCGYKSLKQLLRFAEMVTQRLGEVVYVREKDWTSKRKSIKYLIIKSKHDFYYLLCLGTITLTGSVIKSIFHDHDEPLQFTLQIVGKDQLDDLNEKYSISYISYDREYRPIKRKDGCSFIELNANSIKSILPDDIGDLSVDDVVVEVRLPILLNEGMTEKLENLHKRRDSGMSNIPESTDKKIIENNEDNASDDDIASLDSFFDDIDLDSLFDDVDEATPFWDEFVSDLFGTEEEMLQYVKTYLKYI